MLKDSPYEYYNDALGVKIGYLFFDQKKAFHENSIRVIQYRTLRQRLDRHSCAEKQLRRASKGIEGLVRWDSICQEWKEKLIEKFGNPPERITESWFAQNYVWDAKAYRFYSAYGYGEREKPLTHEERNKYTYQASVLNTVTAVMRRRRADLKKLHSKATDPWEAMLQDVRNFTAVEHGLLFVNKDSLRRKHREYLKNGYTYLISRKRQNTNRLIIKEEIADWLLAQYCLPIKMTVPMLIARYDIERQRRDWKELDERSVNAWLEKPEVKRIWTLARHGREEYNRLYAHKISRDRSQWFPNCYWAIDGSKLDWIHYADNDLKMAAKLKINPLIDIYSEKIIGYSLSETENHTDHFTAVKMALKTSGCRPYLLTYDNQSGHKSARMQELYNNLIATDGGTHYASRPGDKSNPAEQVFSRLQQQVVNQMWFSDKQSVKAKKDDSRVNMDFIRENKHRLYKKEYLIKAWEACVTQWNQSYHSQFKDMTRDQVYRQAMPMRESVDALEMINLFWIEETRPVTYRREGITIQIGHNKYTYEVYDQDNRIDLEFRRQHVGERFAVRYDPEALDTYVQLIAISPSGEKTQIAVAQPKRAHETVPVLMKEGAKEAWYEDYKTRDLEYERDLAAYQELVARTGVSTESLIDEQDLLIKMGGALPKDMRNELETNILARL